MIHGADVTIGEIRVASEKPLSQFLYSIIKHTPQFIIALCRESMVFSMECLATCSAYVTAKVQPICVLTYLNNVLSNQPAHVCQPAC